MTDQIRETIDRLEEFKEPLIDSVAALQMIPPLKYTEAVKAKIWEYLTNTANAMRDGKPRTYAGIEEFCFNVISAFDPTAAAIPIDPPAITEEPEPKKKKK